MRYLYTLCLTLAMPLVVLRLLWRSRLSPGYRQRMGERFAHLPACLPAGVIWVHAVSVGETIAAVPLVKGLQQAHPGTPVLVTSTTPTGSERVRALFGDSVAHAYMPYDLPWLLWRFIARVQPKILVILETELWPNTLAACAHAGIPVVLANARLSGKSARGYARLGALSRGMMQHLSAVAVQNAADGERFLTLGLPAARLSVTGSVKFDLTLDDALQQQAAALRAAWSGHGRHPLWIAASTHEGEDTLLLQAHAQLLRQFPALRLLLVPRHPERFDRVAAQVTQAGLHVYRRSEGGEPGEEVQVILGDSMGELLLFYGVADIAFVGGSFVPVGGHNLLEPAAWGIPVLSGPHLHNFAQVSTLLSGAGALQVLAREGELVTAVTALLQSAAAREKAGQAGKAVLAANRGAVSRQLAIISSCLR